MCVTLEGLLAPLLAPVPFSFLLLVMLHSQGSGRDVPHLLTTMTRELPHPAEVEAGEEVD